METDVSGVRAIAPGGGEPGGIFFLGDDRKIPRDFESFRTLFTHFISSAPQDDAGMIPVPADKRTEVGFRPIGE